MTSACCRSADVGVARKPSPLATAEVEHRRKENILFEDSGEPDAHIKPPDALQVPVIHSLLRRLYFMKCVIIKPLSVKFDW